MRHSFFPRDVLRWRDDVLVGARLQAISDSHKRELDTLERTLGRRVEAAERLLSFVLFEQEVARQQIIALMDEVRDLRAVVVSRADSPAPSLQSSVVDVESMSLVDHPL